MIYTDSDSGVKLDETIYLGSCSTKHASQLADDWESGLTKHLT